MKSLSETADYCSRCGADLQIVSLKFSWRGVETKAACPECTTIASVRVPADRDHRFQAIVITHSRAS
jgi:uncharacterized Zn finger protein